MHTHTGLRNHWLLVALGVVSLAATAFPAGMISTKYNVFVPPSNDNAARHPSLIVTSLHDSALVTIVDDSADGDNDDSWSGVLMKGETYFIKLRQGAVNDDVGGKQDGDFFKVVSSKPVFVVNMTDSTTWQHDFVPSDNKMVGTNFYLYTPSFQYLNPAAVIFAYYGNTDVRIIDITQSAVISSGKVTVKPDAQGTVTKLLLANAGNTSNLLSLIPGHTYHIVTSKNVGLQYGALYYQGGPWGTTENSRDGAAYVPSENGSKVGTNFYFMIPSLHIDMEMRIISYLSGAHVKVYGSSNAGTSYTLVTEFDLNKYDHKDLIGTTGLGSYHFFHVVSNKNIAVFEGTWMETGNYGTSDMATTVSSEDGQSQGKTFTTYMAPPGNEPVNAVQSATRLSHLYFYANDTTSIEVYDIDSYGEYVELYNTQDTTVRLANWVLAGFDGSCVFGAADTIRAHGYFLVEYHQKATSAAAGLVAGTSYPNFRLRNGSDRLMLRNGAATVDMVTYKNTWGSHGNYYALERKDPQGNSNIDTNWADAAAGAFHADNNGVNLGAYYGTPGAQNSRYQVGGNGSKTVVINEIMSGRYYRTLSVNYDTYGDVAIDTTVWEAINNGDNPNQNTFNDPEAPYLTVKTDKMVSVINSNWNDNWLAFVGAIIPPSPRLTFVPDYYQRRTGKQVVFTITCQNIMYDSLAQVTTVVNLTKKMDYTPGSYTAPAYLSGITPTQVLNADSTWTITWNHGARGMKNNEVYTFTITATVDAGLSDSTILSNQVLVTGHHDGDVYSAQEYANVLVGVEKSMNAIQFVNAAGESTAAYGRGDSARVAVRDDDENENVLVRDSLRLWVLNPANGDSERLTLRETGLNTGRFAAAVLTALSGAAGKNNGVLVANAYDTLTARYVDEDDASDIGVTTAVMLGLSRIVICRPNGDTVRAVSATTDMDTLVFVVNGYDSLNTVYPRLTATWSMTGGIGAVQPDNADSTQLVLNRTGSGRVVAVVAGRTDTTGLITVTAGRAATVRLAPAAYSGGTGDTVTFTAEGQDADSNVTADLGLLAWTGGSRVGAWIDSTGDTARLHLARSGVDSVVVTSSYGPADTSGSIAATHGAAVRVRISVDSAAVSADSTVRFMVWAYDAAGDSWVADSQTVWGTDDSTATVLYGLYTPVRAGTNHIYTTLNSNRDTCVVTVRHGAAVAVMVTPDSAQVVEQSTRQFRADGQDADGNVWDVTDAAVWNETDPRGTISAQGLYAAGDSLGAFRVRAVYAGRTDSARVVVISGGALDYISIEYKDGRTAGDTTLGADNDTTALYARWYTSAHTAMGYSSVHWYLTGQAVGTVDSGPDSATMLRLDRPGQCRLVAVFNNSIRDTTGLITVTTGQLARLAVSPQTAVLDIADTLALTATGFDADNNPVSTLGTLIWNGGEHIGTYRDSLGTTAQFTATMPGLDTLAVQSSLGAQGHSGSIRVMPDVPVRLEITPDTAMVTTDMVVVLQVTGFDAFGNQVPDSVLDIVWRGGSAIGHFSDSLGRDGGFTVTRVGVDSVMAFDRAHSLADTSGKIRSTAGAVFSIRIFGGNDTVRTTASRACSAYTYDADTNRIGAVVVNWGVGGGIGGACVPASGPVTSYEPGSAIGTGYVYAHLSNTYYDTLRTVVIAGTVSRITIVDSVLNEVGALSLTTDQDGRKFYVLGYDGGNRAMGLSAVTWAVIGVDSVGQVQPATGESTALELMHAGMGRLVVVFNDSIRDTTGLITVTTGQLSRLAVSPQTAVLDIADTLALTVTGFDADNNPVSTLGTLVWNGGEHIGTYRDSLGTTAQFTATTPGLDTLDVQSSLGAQGRSGSIRVMPDVPVRLEITPDTAMVTTDMVVVLQVTGFDAFGNQVPDSVLDIVWRGGSAIGHFFDSLGRDGGFTVTRVGVDSVMAFDRAHSIADTSGKIRSTAGAVFSVRIFGGNDTVRTTASRACSAYTYDADTNRIGAVAVSWGVGGGIGGACVPASGAVTAYQPASATGTGYVYAHLSNTYYDTLRTVVIAGTVSEIRIVDGAGQEVGGLSLTTDQDDRKFYVRGYDGGGRELGAAAVVWEVIGLDGIGQAQPASGESTALELMHTGVGRLVAVFNDSISDTTGLISVSGGHARQMVISPDNGTVPADDSLRFTVMGVDADSNSTSDLGIIVWSTQGSITGGFTPNNTTASDTVWFNPAQAGQGQVKARSTTYGIEDLSGLITVIPGDTAYIAIVPAGPETMYLRETRMFYSLGYDADSNFVDTIAAQWDTLGNLRGAFSTFINTPVLSYISSLAGQGRITARRGSMSDTVTVEVLPYAVDSVVLMTAAHAALGDTDWTTDHDSIELVAQGYGHDSSGVVDLGRVNVVWSIAGTVVGSFTRNNASSVFLMLDRPGTAQIGVVYQSGLATDVSGTIIVRPGQARSLVLTPDSVSRPVDDTLMLSVDIRDADHNATTNYGALTWSHGNRVRELSPADSLRPRFICDSLGVDTIVVTAGYGLTAACRVQVIPRPDSFAVAVHKTTPYLKEAALCTLKVLDRFGSVITGYNQALHRIVIQTVVRTNGVERTPQGMVEFSGSGVVDNGNDGYIPAGTLFDAGRLVVRVKYTRAGDSLLIKFREDVTNISGISDAVMWLDPYLLSQVFLFPSPVDFNNQPMKIDYLLKYPADVQVRIFSAEGSLVYENNYNPDGLGGQRGGNHIEWDGRNRHGKNVGSGAYVARIRVTCPEGEMEQRVKIGVAGRK